MLNRNGTVPQFNKETSYNSNLELMHKNHFKFKSVALKIGLEITEISPEK